MSINFVILSIDHALHICIQCCMHGLAFAHSLWVGVRVCGLFCYVACGRNVRLKSFGRNLRFVDNDKGDFWMNFLTMSGPRRTRRGAMNGMDPPTTPPTVVMRPSPRSSSVSALTTPSLASRLAVANDPLSMLTTNTVLTPAVREQCDPPADTAPLVFYDAMEDEELLDRKYAGEGASDSEDEGDDDFISETLKLRQECEEGNIAAMVSESDFIASMELSAASTSRKIPGAPDNWNPPSAPEDWTPPKPATGFDHPKFEDIDNPGGWSNYTFQAKYKRKGNKVTDYMYHALPTGATPVPLNKDGKRSVGGWEFHYQGWKLDENHPTKFRSGATKDDPFPECRKGSLDGAVLEKLGLDGGRMCEDDGAPDSLFFFQLLLPISTGIDDDPRGVTCFRENCHD